MGFSENLKKYREEHHYSQADIAKALKISDRTVGLWERGETMPRLDLALKLSAFLGISLNELVNDDEIFMMQAKAAYGPRGAKQAEEMLVQCRSLFYGGSLSPDDMDAFFQVMTEMYFDAKQKAKKYSASKNETVK